MKKTTFYATLFSLVLFMGFSGKVSAGDGRSAEMLMNPSAQVGQNNGWILATSSGNVDFYYKMAECNGEKVVFLKFDNKNNYTVKVSWKEAVMDKVFNKVTNAYYGQKEINLAPGVTGNDNCSSSGCAECMVGLTNFAATHAVDAQNFQFREITVSPSSN